MKLDNTVETESVSNLASENELMFGMDTSEEGLRALMVNMTGLYADSKRAVLRENGQNAIDAGGSRPAEITLPSVEDPRLIFQDFGTGMSRLFATTTYLRYGGSGKRNDAKKRGGFGLGSKTPHLISDQYTVTTIHRNDEGELEYTALLIMNDNGVPKPELLPTPAVIPDQTGTIIEIPLSDDVTPEVQAAWAALAADVFCTFGDLINVDGVPVPQASEKMTQITDKVSLGANLSGVREGEGLSRQSGLYAVIGDIGYPINFFDSYISRYEKDLALILVNQAKSGEAKVFVHADPSNLSVPPARNEVKDTEANRKFVTEALREAGEQMLADIRTRINTAPNLSAAAKEFIAAREEFFTPSTYANVGLNNFVYKGVEHESIIYIKSVGSEFRNDRASRADRPLSVSLNNLRSSCAHLLFVTGIPEKEMKKARSLARPFFLGRDKDYSDIRLLRFATSTEVTEEWFYAGPDKDRSFCRVISYDDYFKIADASRKELLAEKRAQNGGNSAAAVAARKSGYTVHSWDKEDETFIQDDYSLQDLREMAEDANNVYFAEAGSFILPSSANSLEDVISSGDIVFALRATQNVDVFTKRFPSAVPFSEARKRFVEQQIARIPSEVLDNAAVVLAEKAIAYYVRPFVEFFYQVSLSGGSLPAEVKKFTDARSKFHGFSSEELREASEAISLLRSQNMLSVKVDQKLSEELGEFDLIDFVQGNFPLIQGAQLPKPGSLSFDHAVKYIDMLVQA